MYVCGGKYICNQTALCLYLTISLICLNVNERSRLVARK